ncbi:MAG: S8 family peptidase [Chthoniobacterales bacterium]|nr:S8 family peptidase [Chthoniobacterales bacterium]
MSPAARFSHLFLPEPTKPHDNYSSPRRGSGPRIKPQDRATQAARIKERLEAAWQTALDRQAVAHSEKHGVYLEFSSEPGFDLVLKSLESKGGIKLLNVHTEGPKDTEVTRATVFIPQEQSGYFLQKVTAYANEDNRPKKDGTTTPKNGTLINSIADVRAALLEKAFWQDSPDKLPDENPDWIEAWLSSEDLGVIETFTSLCQQENIPLGEGRLTFPERVVLLIQANRAQLERIIELSDALAEFRAVRKLASYFVEMENRDQAVEVQKLLERSQIQDPDQNVVLILDHGVNNGHLLLAPVLTAEDCHSVKPEWGVNDHHGHGTLMAGTAAYGDLLELLQNEHPIIVRHGLESAKILPPDGQNEKRLWGFFTAQGISLAEIQAPYRKRVICMAVTSEEDPTRGRPSSWSAQVDDLASGASDEIKRLLVVSGGNVNDSSDWKNYPNSNKTVQIHDPAQAWNALTVGAYTRKVQMTHPDLATYQAVASEGNLSPYSSTSLTWPERMWPIKPEVLFEGGNVARGPNDSIFDADDLKLISTYRDIQIAQFAPFWATSAASAQCAWMAAQIQATYPDAWPETIRALIVHSAEWTPEQKQHFLAPDQSKTSYARLARVCGYGVANLDRALSCAANSLSLIAQTSIQPFDKHNTESRYVSKDMHLHRLPWPNEILSGLGETMVKMRVTLSYFVEASPGEVGWKDRYRYASHGLRFELNGPGEAEAEFIQRVNRIAREEDAHPGTEGAGNHWTLGETRNVGSIHSDIWRGTAAQLALSNLIAVHPTVGWWRERHHLGKFNKQTRYSLVVSFELPGQDVDIYTPIATQLGIAAPVTIEIPV